MSNKTDNKSDDYPLYFLLIWMPIVVIFIVTSSSNDPNSLLTDDQKLEKQKELAQIEEEKELKKQEEAQWWSDNINYILDEKPFPYVHLIGLLIFGSIIIGYSRGRYRHHYDWWSRLANPFLIFPLFTGFIYLAWLTGNFSIQDMSFINIGESP